MYIDATRVTNLGGYLLEVEFETGEIGVVDFSNYPSMGGVFSRFLDMKYFHQVYINKELGVLCWPPGDIDIAPETIYSMATGKPLPDWMEAESDDTVIKSGSED